MTTRIKTMIAAGAAAVMLAGAAPMVLAQQDQPQQRRGVGAPGERGPRGGMRGPGFGRPEFRNLDLSDDQTAQLKKIRDARQAEFKAAGDKLGTARQGMRALLDADSLNEGAIRAKSQEVAAAEAELAILNAKLRRESMQILTAEQLAKLKQQRENRGPRQRRGQA
jgi:Spy/CpxP family protein refolding chaperone